MNEYEMTDDEINSYPVQLPELDSAREDSLREAEGRVYDFFGVCENDTILK